MPIKTLTASAAHSPARQAYRYAYTLSVPLPQDQYDKLHAFAAATGVSMAQITRDALADYLKPAKPKAAVLPPPPPPAVRRADR